MTISKLIFIGTLIIVILIACIINVQFTTSKLPLIKKNTSINEDINLNTFSKPNEFLHNTRILQFLSDNEGETVTGNQFSGSWKSLSSNTFGNFFGNSKGRAYFELAETDTEQAFYFTLFDGEYIDGHDMLITIYFNNASDYVADSKWQNNNTQLILDLYNNNNKLSSVNCSNINYMVEFIDSSKNLPLPDYEDAENIADINAYFNLSANGSNECSFNITGVTNGSQGSFQSATMKYSIMVTIICVIHLYACIQMIKNITENEHEGRKISLLTVGFLTTWDVFLCLYHLSAALTVYDYFHYFITPAFWYFILASIFETRLILIIWKTKYYDRFQNMNELRRGIVSFYMKFYGLMAVILIISYYLVPDTWYFLICSLFFLPQIIHNAIRGQKHRAYPTYIYCLGIIRILVPLYVRAYPGNIFLLTPSYNYLAWYLALIFSQTLMLHLQSKFGSRFFIPACFLPPKFNYFRTISTSTLEQMDECPICYDPINQEPSDQSAQLLKQTKTIKIMITPCKHKFHVKCLQEWMNVKLECPFCRQAIPPLD